MKTIYILLIPIVIIFSCEPEITPTRHFVVRAGNHYASPKPMETLQQDKLSFDARFDKSAIYDLGDPALQTNKNKLMGFSDCNTLHHDNSARFAWQWLNNRVEIFAYCYTNGERKEAFVGAVEIDTYNQYEIQIQGDRYVFRLNEGEPVYMERGSVCDTGLYYMLWPYFGGSIPAPHDVHIDIMMNF